MPRRAMAKVGAIRGSRVLLARADAADPALPRTLREMGAQVEDVVAYHTTTAPDASRRSLQSALAGGDVEAILFASGSAVRNLSNSSLTVTVSAPQRLAKCNADIGRVGCSDGPGGRAS